MVEIIPKEVPAVPKWLNILFYFALILLIFSIIGFFILNNSLKNSKAELTDLESSLLKKETASEKISLEKEILSYQNKIENFSSLTSQHLVSSKFFEIIQKITHPKVWFSTFSLNSREGSVELSGLSRDFESLEQQLLILREEKIIENVDLKNISITKEGGISFNLSLSFNPEILK